MKFILNKIGFCVLGIAMFGFQIPGFAAATKISSCPYTITKTGLHVVTKNMNCAGDGITIAQDYVTLDLRGFTLRGDGTGSGITDAGSAQSVIVIKNGTLLNFDSGVMISASEDAEISGMRITENVGAAGYGIFAEEGAHIFDNTVTDNANVGIGTGNVFNAVIENNLVRDNGWNGIEAGLGCIVRGNLVAFSGNNGIESISRCTISDNFVHNNSNIGIDSGIDSLVQGNNTTNNISWGISGTCGSVFLDNMSANNNGGALQNIYAGNAADCVAENNNPPF